MHPSCLSSRQSTHQFHAPRIYEDRHVHRRRNTIPVVPTFTSPAPSRKRLAHAGRHRRALCAGVREDRCSGCAAEMCGGLPIALCPPVPTLSPSCADRSFRRARSLLAILSRISIDSTGGDFPFLRRSSCHSPAPCTSTPERVNLSSRFLISPRSIRGAPDLGFPLFRCSSSASTASFARSSSLRHVPQTVDRRLSVHDLRA
ncbi:hypothetical protein B0H13DRAFT_2578144 [Mycena leptocephala]|nr:hypothetical protein B0H13DRAFT_2578144 [Mycena leptocephala]